MSELMERLDNLRALIQEPEFLEGKGLSNEVNIRIFCYDPKDEMAVRHFTEMLMTDQSLNCHLIEYNLYKVFLSICDDKRITDRVAQQEEKKGKQFVLDQMKRMANNTAFIGKMQYCIRTVLEAGETVERQEHAPEQVCQPTDKEHGRTKEVKPRRRDQPDAR